MKTLRYTLAITVAVAILAVAVALLVKGVKELFRNNDPGQGGDTVTVTGGVTPTGEPTKEPEVTEPAEPTATPELSPTQDARAQWDGNAKPTILTLSAAGEEIVVELTEVPGASSYVAELRKGEDDRQLVAISGTAGVLTVAAGETYTVRVQAIGPNGESGAYSDESTVTVDPIKPQLTLSGLTRLTASFTLAGAGEGGEYVLRYKQTDATDWCELVTTETSVGVGALVAGKQYEAELAIRGAVQNEYVSERVQFVPEGVGYGDPFLNAGGIIRVGEEKKPVQYTAPAGCLGINCWMEFDEGLYTSSELTEKVRDLAGGTAMQISADENGQYVCILADNRYAVHVTAADPAVEAQKDGWVLGNAILVDLAMIFPQTNVYSIHYNRTNATASVFTCGGDAMKIDADSPEETRYDPLRVADAATSLATTGYNIIGGVTGEALPNYGSPEQIPAVWDLAIQLLTAQRNALAKGTCLLIYESYRPNSTSKFVYKAMKEYGYFREEIPSTIVEEGKEPKMLTLANGFLDKTYTEANFIAVDSNHNKGIALDLTICQYNTLDELGDELEMQTKMHTLDFRGNMDYNTEAATQLYEIMTEGTGLIPLRGRQEWWHFELNKNIEDFPCIKDYVFADYTL